MIKNCNSCEKKFRGRAKNKGCQVFKEKMENCWAWTDDKEWLEEVNKQVKEYKGIHG